MREAVDAYLTGYWKDERGFADIRDTLKKKAIRDDAEKSFKGVYRG